MYSFFLNFDIVHSNLSEYLCLHIFSKSHKIYKQTYKCVELAFQF